MRILTSNHLTLAAKKYFLLFESFERSQILVTLVKSREHVLLAYDVLQNCSMARQYICHDCTLGKSPHRRNLSITEKIVWLTVSDMGNRKAIDHWQHTGIH